MQSSSQLLRTTLEHALDKPVDALDEAELRHAVDAYVDAHKKGGIPPERLLIELKELARSAVRQHRLSRGEPPVEDSASRAVLDRVVRWAIERFYRHSKP